MSFAYRAPSSCHWRPSGCKTQTVRRHRGAGAVIRGQTPISIRLRRVCRGPDPSASSNACDGFGVLTTDTMDQAMDRAGGSPATRVTMRCWRRWRCSTLLRQLDRPSPASCCHRSALGRAACWCSPYQRQTPSHSAAEIVASFPRRRILRRSTWSTFRACSARILDDTVGPMR